MSEVTATDHVHALVDAGEVSKAIADRLDDNGFETVADLLIADQADLEEVPYVGAERAADILATVDGIDKPEPEPRDVDLEATESVVSEAAIPLSVRRGGAVLVAHKGGTDRRYHTRHCGTVTYESSNLATRSWEYVEDHDLDECKRCEDPSRCDGRAEQPTSDRDADPLVDPREAALEASLGEKLQVAFANGTSWADPRVVVATEEPVTWETATGETWQTRRIRISTSATRQPEAKEYDLVVGADGVWVEDPDDAGRVDDACRDVESVGAVGRVSQSSYYQLKGQKEETAPEQPEGDDTWRQYQNRGEA